MARSASCPPARRSRATGAAVRYYQPRLVARQVHARGVYLMAAWSSSRIRSSRRSVLKIQFDYVRFPSDGDLSLVRHPGTHAQAMRWTIPAFVHYASKRLHPLGVRVSVDVFGLSATRDLGIGQLPRRLSGSADAVYPMVYPSHYNPGEYGIDDPNAWPGRTVMRSLSDF